MALPSSSYQLDFLLAPFASFESLSIASCDLYIFSPIYRWLSLPLGCLTASSMPLCCLLLLDLLWALDLTSLKLNLSYLGRSTLHGAARLYSLTSSHLVVASRDPTPAVADLWIWKTFLGYLLFFYCVPSSRLAKISTSYSARRLQAPCLHRPPHSPMRGGRMKIPARGLHDMPCHFICWFSCCKTVSVIFPLLLYFFFLFNFMVVFLPFGVCSLILFLRVWVLINAIDSTFLNVGSLYKNTGRFSFGDP